ncbi:MAG: hypothetical protein IPL49_13015 [Saprospirales bacterium]|nr:hypothetical protein [Saprospirales bacterium]
MSEIPSEKKSWLERMKHTYRLVIMNNETFEEIGSYQLSLFNVYIFLSTLMVVVAFLVISLIIFTPSSGIFRDMGTPAPNRSSSASTRMSIHSRS